MNEFMDILANFHIFLLILVRSTGLLAVAPVMGSRNVPGRIRIGLGFVLATLLLPLASMAEGVGHHMEEIFFLAVLNELLVGFMLGFVFMLVMATIQLAGQFIDVRMGFAIANVVDPQFQTQVPLVGQFKYLLTVFVFLITDTHHFLIYSLYRTYALIPLGGARFPGELAEFFITATSQLFMQAFRIALPIMGILFVIDIAFGIVARAVPQMNVFILGFPVKILVGLLCLALTMPYFVSGLIRLFQWMEDNVHVLIGLLS